MAQNTTLNGVSYSIPDPGDTGWGASLTAFLVAIAPGVLQKTGGTFILTADVNFGAAFGLKSAYFATRASNPSSTGILRLANSDTFGFRNFTNSGNLLFSVNASDGLLFNGSPIGQFVSTADRAVITNGSGTLAVSPTTATEVGYVSGVTAAIQAQLNTKATDSLVVHLAGSETITGTKIFSSTAGTRLHGVITNTSVVAGDVGEVMAASALSTPTSATWTNITSLSLTPGHWLVSCNVAVETVGISTTPQNCNIAIDPAVGNPSVNVANNYMYINVSASQNSSGNINDLEILLNSTTTYYLKVFIVYGATAPNITGKLTALRIG